MEIVLVEDSLIDARLTMGALQQVGFRHRLTLIRDGEEALEFLNQRGRFVRAPRPDLILLDLFLPKLDGIEVLQEIKNDFSLKRIPVVVMTASSTEEDKYRCELLSVDSYITKPVNMHKFLRVVKQLKNYLREDLILPSLD
jgi:chemotaxis family two-component system response regulator Rcp1